MGDAEPEFDSVVAVTLYVAKHGRKRVDRSYWESPPGDHRYWIELWYETLPAEPEVETFEAMLERLAAVAVASREIIEDSKRLMARAALAQAGMSGLVEAAIAKLPSAPRGDRLTFT